MAVLYADEHVPLAVIKALRRAGHDVLRALERYPEGTEDLTHFERAVQENRVFLTQDTDFLALSSKMLSEGKHHPGVIYWPQGTPTGSAKLSVGSSSTWRPPPRNPGRIWSNSCSQAHL